MAIFNIWFHFKYIIVHLFLFCCSLNGYGNINIFKDIVDEDIDYIETYARTDLIDLLNKKARECECELDNDLLAAFFGIYGVCPQSFQIVKGNRKLIFKLAARVGDKLMEHEGFKYFEDKTLPKKRKFIMNNTTESLFGLIYGDFSRRPKVTEFADFRREDMKNKLFDQAKKLFDTYEEEMINRNCPQFTIDMVEINASDNSIKGNVMCAICQKQKTKVSCKLNSGVKSFTWVMSNVNSHIKHCLKSQRFDEVNGLQPTNSSTKREHTRVANSNANSHDAITINLSTTSVASDDGTQSRLENQLHPPNSSKKSAHTRPVQTNSHDATTINLDITPIHSNEDMQNHLESLLDSQIAVQVVRMSNTVHQCKDPQQTINCIMDEKASKSSIKICDVPSNGDCFFSAVSHQLTYLKINSTEHKTDTENLRKATAEYIGMNLQNYIHNIKNRLLESGQQIDQNNLEVQCLQFVKNHLSKAGTYAGTESFFAVSAMKEVNIVVFNEMGTCYFGSKFDPSYKQTILIAFRGSNGQKNENRNHFGSVTEIKSKLVTIASQFLIKNLMQYIRNKNRNSVVNVE